jgi:geranylgeranyl pyrophosphate synthase
MDRSKQLLNLVEGCMTRVTCAPGEEEALIVRAVAHHLCAGGARIRALVCLHAGQRLGLSDGTSVVLATACELLHNASLVQDDVFDRETMRRGVESAWKRFGDTVAICAGDLMLAGAFAVLSEIPDTTLIAPAIRLAFRHTKSVVIGQGTEMDALPVNLQGYETIAIAKSASLLTLPLHLPLLIGGQTSFLPLAQSVAEAFAVAYQIADDLEDYEQDQKAGALNVLSVLCDHGELKLDDARAVASDRAIELLHRCMDDAAQLPNSCSAIIVQHARNMLLTFQANSSVQLARVGSLQYVG